MLKTSLFVLCLFFILSPIMAQSENGDESSFTQPNGSELVLRIIGNTHYARIENSRGYTVVFDHETQAYFFAMLSGDQTEFLPSTELATNEIPSSLKVEQGLRVSARSRQVKAKEQYDEFEKAVKQRERWNKFKQNSTQYRNFNAQKAGGPTLAPPNNPPTLGDLVGLTILVDFSDEVARSALTPQKFDNFCNKVGGEWANNGSVYDYFYKQSNGRLSYVNNVTYYVRVPHPYDYYNDTSAPRNSGVNGRKLLGDAVAQLLTEGFDFSGLTVNGDSRVIATNLFWAGNDSGVWASGLWPHRFTTPPIDIGGGKFIFDYQMTDIGTTGTPTIGTFCHEDGHMIGQYGDYYDYGNDGQGVGQHCLMGSGNHTSPTNPANISGYLKYHSGWVDAVDLNSLSGPIRLSADVDPTQVFKYTNSTNSEEYFIIENRSRIGGWEASGNKPDSGIMISHIDEGVPQSIQGGFNSDGDMTTARHYEHSIEQADNLFELERTSDRGDETDLFHTGGTGPNTSFTDSSSPNAKWWAGATGNGASGTNSGLNIHDIGAPGSTMTFVLGAGVPSGPATIGLSTRILENACDYQTNATQQIFAVNNSQSGTLSYSISDDAAWLSCSSSSGTSTTEADTISVAYDTIGLAVGVHNATITVTGGGGTETIAVALTVRSEPILAVSGATLNSTIETGTVDFDTFRVTNSGGGTLVYTLSSDQSWMTFNEDSGTVSRETDLVSVNYDAVGLVAGTYTGTITVVSAGVGGSPKTIDVTLTVTD